MRIEDLEPIKGKLKKDLSGKRFNRLFVIKPIGRNNKSICYLCKCDCGVVKIIRGSSLVSGDSKSCGCLHAYVNRTRNLQHGLSKTAEYRIWTLMKDRCLNENNNCSDYYKERNIRVSHAWMNSFETFYKEMGPRPSDKHTIDRINSNFNYTKWNCRWATRKQQSRNLSSNMNITFNGKTQCLAAWAEELNIVYSTLSSRLNKLGWPVEKALNTKTRKRKN